MQVPKSPMDKFSERVTRRLANFSSRRGFIARIGVALIAAPVLPLLPVARVTAAEPAPKTDFERNAQAKDPNKCNYWRYCAIDGVLCGCCGGGVHTCPPGAEPSPISWIGTCMNPEDGRSYVIAYRDCCGKPVCQADKDCRCDSVDRELPLYRQQLNNDIVWCFGNAAASYHCSTAALVGMAG
jgi:methylamine dehydrogenase light chain